MFKRRVPLGFVETIKQFFWPTMGWKRALCYTKHRVLRISDNTHNIALGLAFGLGISFTPLLGTHFIQAGALAFMFRANIAAAMIGTFVGNPLTFPFFWWAGISSGSFIFALFGMSAEANIPEDLTVPAFWDIVTSRPWDLFMPWMVGGYLLALVSIPAAYWVYYQFVTAAKIAKDRAFRLRQKERAKSGKIKKEADE